MPMIAASSDTLVFDSTLVNTQSQTTLYICNTGLDSLNIININSSHPYFSLDTTLFRLAYSSNKQLSVTYLPQDAGVHTAELKIVSNAHNRDTLTLTLRGVAIASTGLDLTDSSIPTEYNLAQNYPNPFNPNTTIHYELPKGSDVKLSVYNLLGQKVKTLVSGWNAAGRYDVEWRGDNDLGYPVGSGVYIYRFVARSSLSGKLGDYQKTMKMMLLK
jgi:hypothetical protein